MTRSSRCADEGLRLQIAEDNVVGASRFETAAAIVATVAIGIVAVWLTEDLRAFGIVVALVGLVVGIVRGRQEWRTSCSRRSAATAPRDADIRKAA
jgi:hypothetical protein